MDIFPLSIFPIGSLANSVVTTVWIGVLVVGFLNLRLGWVLSGLVVPGYLAPLLIAKPWAASAVILEGIVTYLLVWLYSERVMRWLGLGGFFGRDRFFAMILISVLVRILFDGWVFPVLGEWANDTFRLQFDYRYNLHSFGLIIVSLIANQFWKTGLIRGITPFAITLVITWLITRYGLMELTNFSISNISYMYEDMAASMLASPKSYIILITAAFIASRMNLHYGWDFNGILIPSLLALQWYQPDKILFSFVEALVVLGLGMLLLRLPYYQRVTVEGARKLMLFFNISFVWKIALGYFLVAYFPQLKVTDYFGFGYMLPTLIAIKMHDKEIVARMTRATLQISLVAVAGATLVGFALTYISIPISWSALPSEQARFEPPQKRAHSLIEYLREEKLALYQTRRDLSYTPPLAVESDLFIEGIRLLKRYQTNPDPELLDQARSRLKQINYYVRHLGRDYLVMEEGRPRRGWGSYLFNLNAQSRLLVEVPAPLEEWGSLESGGWILQQAAGRALAIAGSARTALRDGSADVLRSYQTPFQIFHREMSSTEVVQVRALSGENRRALTGVRTEGSDAAQAIDDGQVWVRGTLPQGVDWVALEAVAPSLSFHWATPPLVNIQRATSRQRFAEIFFTEPTLRRILLQAMQAELTPQLTVDDLRIDGYLQERLYNSKEAIAPQGSDRYRPPRFGDLLFWDSEVITPLIATAEAHYQRQGWQPEGIEKLKTIGAAAARFGYEITRYRHRATHTDYLLLSERTGEQPNYWGTYVMRLGEAQDFLVQAPRPLYEGASFEFAVQLFESLEARWLLIGGTHPNANRDGSADLIRNRSPHHLFNLFNQVILREAGARPMQVVQCRAYGVSPDDVHPGADVLVAFSSGIRDRERLPPLGQTLLAELSQQALSSRFVDGTEGTSGYEVGLVPQAKYLDATTGNKDFAMLWLAPEARRGFRQQGDNLHRRARYQAMGIRTHEEDLALSIQRSRLGATAQIPAPWMRALQQLQRFGDFIPLRALMRTNPAIELRRVIDINTSQPFLMVKDGAGRLLLVLNLDPRSPEQQVRLSAHESEAITRFIERRAGRLEISGGNRR